MSDGQVEPDTSGAVAALDAGALELVRRLLALPPATARRIRDEAPRRRARRPQRGPGLDLGSDG